MDVTDFCKEEYGASFGMLLLPEFMQKTREQKKLTSQVSENAVTSINRCESMESRDDDQTNAHLERLPLQIFHRALMYADVTFKDVAAFSRTCGYCFTLANKTNDTLWQCKFMQTFLRLSSRTETLQKLVGSGTFWQILFQSRIEIERECFKMLDEVADEVWDQEGIASIDWSHLRKLARRISHHAEWPLLVEDALFAIAGAATHATRNEKPPSKPYDIHTRSYGWVRQQISVQYYARAIYDEVVRAFLRPFLYETVSTSPNSLDMFKVLHIFSHYIEPSYFLEDYYSCDEKESFYSRGCATSQAIAQRVAERYSAHKNAKYGESWHATALTPGARCSNVPATEIEKVLSVLNDVLFDEEKYQLTNDETYPRLRQYFKLLSILKLPTKKLCLPILMCAFYKKIAEQLGIMLEAVNMPMKFLLGYAVPPRDTKNQSEKRNYSQITDFMFVDPSEHGAVMGSDIIGTRLHGRGDDAEEDSIRFEFRVAYPGSVVLNRHCNNLHSMLNSVQMQIQDIHHSESFRSQFVTFKQAAADLRYIAELFPADGNSRPVISTAAFEMKRVCASVPKYTAECELIKHIEQDFAGVEQQQQKKSSDAAGEEDWYLKLYNDAEQLAGEKLEERRRYTREKKPRKKEMWPVGMAMWHKRFSYTCVIYSRDNVCAQSQDWQDHMRIDKLARGAKQPFYGVLVNDHSMRYAAEENLEPLLQAKPDAVDAQGNMRQCAHPDLGRYFKRFNGHFYEMLDSLAEIYADDGDKCRVLYKSILASNSKKTSAQASNTDTATTSEQALPQGDQASNSGQ